MSSAFVLGAAVAAGIVVAVHFLEQKKSKIAIALAGPILCVFLAVALVVVLVRNSQIHKLMSQLVSELNGKFFSRGMRWEYVQQIPWRGRHQPAVWGVRKRSGKEKRGKIRQREEKGSATKRRKIDERKKCE